MGRKPRSINIGAIAAQAGVSAGTVSRVINRKNGVGEATRKKIYEILQEHNFTSNYPTQKTIKIAVIVPYFDLTEYYRKALNGIYSYAQKNGLSINIVIAELYSRESLLDVVREQQCSGVIALICQSYQDELLQFSRTELPTVVIDTIIENERIGFIDNDSYFGSCMATKHLIDLGHKRIGYLTYSGNVVNHLQRLKGYENTMKSMGLEIGHEWILKTDYHHAIRAKNGYDGAMHLLSQASNLTAVMVVDDPMAQGAMAAIHDMGLRIPEDISVIGFDNYAESAYLYPALTTVDHPIEKAGYMAIESIHTGLRIPGEWIPLREILPTTLIIRKSTGPALTKTTK